MTAASRSGLGWSARLLIAIALMLAGATAAAWALARYDQAARFLGVAPPPPPPRVVTIPAQAAPATDREPVAAGPQTGDVDRDARIRTLEERLREVETAAQRVEGSAGRADALVVAFAARRAVERGLALGFLEPLLVDRFGAAHPAAVATIISGARNPVRLSGLISEYEEIGPALRGPAPGESWWAGFRREFGELVSVRRADRPSPQPDARYRRAMRLLTDGEVDLALAETMRLPGAPRATDWIAKARRYSAIQRALDEIEAAALLERTSRSSS